MKRADLAGNLAASLVGGAWHPGALRPVLTRRLPAPLHRLAEGLARDLFQSLRQPYAPAAPVAAAALRDLPTFERVFRFCTRLGVWPHPDLAPPAMAPVDAFAHLDLPQLPTLQALAEWLLVPVDRLDYIADPTSRHEEHGETAINHYHYRLLPKPAGGLRLIEAPKQRLKVIQRQILDRILTPVPVHSHAFGFVRGRNCLDGARRHVAEGVVLAFDLQDFFPSVGQGRVFGLFRCLGYPQAVAATLTALCTTRTPTRVLARMDPARRMVIRQPHLPQGAPTSPALANLVAFRLDCRLSGLARSIGANYSRYADDLSFSGDATIAPVLLAAVLGIVTDEGFRLNPDKTRVMPAAARQTVTGVVVNRHLNVRRADADRLRATSHACGRPGDARLRDAAFRASLIGRIDWVAAVNPGRGRRLRRQLVAVCEAGMNVRAGQ